MGIDRLLVFGDFDIRGPVWAYNKGEGMYVEEEKHVGP